MLFFIVYKWFLRWLFSPSQTKSASLSLIVTCFIQILVLAILTLCFSSAYSQENTEKTKAKASNMTVADLLKEAKLLARDDREKSIDLANKVLIKSKASKNYRVSAQTHTLLGKLSQQLKDIDQSTYHFLQASLLYKKTNDTRSYIMASIDYAKILISKKRFGEADKIIGELLPIAQEYGDELPIYLVLMTRGGGYYQQKRYEEAITQYKHAIKYLLDHDENTQKNLALTYHQIAQSYKQLKNNDQSIVFYKKALEVYTSLQNQDSIARTLKNLAMSERKRRNYLPALDYAIRGLRIQKQLNAPDDLAKALIGAGIIYRLLGRYEESLNHIHEAHLFYKKENKISDIAETSNQMGLIYTRIKKFDQARSFYQLTIDLPEEKVKKKIRAAALREIAVIDFESGHYDSAFVVAKQAYEIYQNENETLKNSITARIIAKIYLAKKNDTQAIVYGREALSLAIESKNIKYQIKSLTLLGQTLTHTNTDEAISLLKKSIDLSTQINLKSEKLYAIQAIRLAEKLRGNIAESLRYAEEEIALSIIVQQEKEKNELIREKANLDSRKMEMELKSLRKQAALDQLELAHKNSEIEIASQAQLISELELTKNRYASFALASLLSICFIVAIFIYRRFVDSRKRNRELDYLAARDPLTNCYNRRILFDLMNRDFSDVDELNEYSIIMADIDHFKAVNDTHGHSAGDAVLRGVANILQEGIRQNDIAARFGGEEFCIILPGAAQDQAIRIAEAIRQKVETSRFDGITVTCSFGVTSIRFNAKTPAALIDQADLALYKSKTGGRNQVTLWDKTLKPAGQEVSS